MRATLFEGIINARSAGALGHPEIIYAFPFEDREINLFGEACLKAVKGGLFVAHIIWINFRIFAPLKNFTTLLLYNVAQACLRGVNGIVTMIHKK